MKTNNKIKLLIIAVILLFIFIYSNISYAYNQFETKNVKITIGRIKGEVCNKTKYFFNEVIVKAIAVNIFNKKIWTETFSINGIGHLQCVGFSKFNPFSDDYYNVKFEYFPDQMSELFNAKTYNKTLSFYNIEYKINLLTGKACNESSNNLEDQLVRLFGVSNSNEILWKRNILINTLTPNSCLNIAKIIPTDDLQSTNKLLFSTNKLNRNHNIKAGKINEEISYKNIIFRSRRFTGEICNDSAEIHDNVFIRFFALRRDNFVWDEVVTIAHIEPNQCVPFIEYTSIDRRPTKWMFIVTGW